MPFTQCVCNLSFQGKTKKKEKEEKKKKKNSVPNTKFVCFFLSSQVVNETLRMANIISGIFRRVTTDINVKGKRKHP